jgi:hypothetical protein
MIYKSPVTVGWGLFFCRGNSYSMPSYGDDSESNAASFGIDAARVVPTANENRPANVAVRYLIRALP